MTWPNPFAAVGRAISRLWTAFNAASLPHLKLLLMLGAGMVMTGLFVAGVLILWKGQWPPDLAGRRLDFIGSSTVLMALGMLMVLAALTAVGVRLKGPGGLEASVGSEPAAGPTISATTTAGGQVSISATPAPAAPVAAPAPPPQPTGDRNDLAS